MGIESDQIWMDGEFVPFADAKVHVLSHTLHYGMGAFEGIRSYTQPDGSAGVWRLHEHLVRFLDTLKMMRMEIPYSLDDLVEACLQTLRVNGFSEAYLRPLAFYGAGAMGLGARTNKVHVVIAAWKWGAYLGEEGMQRGVAVKTSTFTRHHPNAALQRAKVVGHYVNSILARVEAAEDGFAEAIMLDQHGFVAEGTGENVFVVKGDRIDTPPATNILPGLTRASIIELLELEGHKVHETFFGRDGFYVADEAWMVGTAAEVTPIREVDRRAVGNGEPGPITRTLQAQYAASVRGTFPAMKHHITVAPIGR